MNRLPVLIFCLLPGAALAHAGHNAGRFSAGFGHPFSGADHMLAMMALGVLAAQIGGRALWSLPLAFLVAMLTGGLLAAENIAFLWVEPTILASGIILGALIAMAVNVPLPVMLDMAAIFGAAHGWAHGAEGPATGQVAYAAGFVAATGLLLAAGAVLGKAIPVMAVRATGLIAVLAGGALAVAG